MLPALGPDCERTRVLTARGGEGHLARQGRGPGVPCRNVLRARGAPVWSARDAWSAARDAWSSPGRVLHPKRRTSVPGGAVAYRAVLVCLPAGPQPCERCRARRDACGDASAMLNSAESLITSAESRSRANSANAAPTQRSLITHRRVSPWRGYLSAQSELLRSHISARSLIFAQSANSAVACRAEPTLIRADPNPTD